MKSEELKSENYTKASQETGFKIEKLPVCNPKDKKGETREWKFKDGHQITVYKRKAGVQFGGHFHYGQDPSKNPEHLLVIHGKVKLLIEPQPGEFPIEKILEAGDAITIKPWLIHEAEAIEDTVMIEYRITHFNKKHPDTLKAGFV